MLKRASKKQCQKLVYIAERPTNGTRRLPKRQRASIDTKINQIIQRSIPARRIVINRNRATNRIRARIRVLILPDPEDTIDIRVVQPEDGVSGRVGEISAWVAAPGEVAAGVHSHVSVGEVALEAVDPGGWVWVVFDDVGCVAVLCPAGGGVD